MASSPQPEVLLPWRPEHVFRNIFPNTEQPIVGTILVCAVKVAHIDLLCDEGMEAAAGRQDFLITEGFSPRGLGGRLRLAPKLPTLASVTEDGGVSITWGAKMCIAEGEDLFNDQVVDTQIR